MSDVNQDKSSRDPEDRIGWREATALLLIYSVSKVFYIFPSRVSKLAQTAAWSVPIFSAFASALWLWALVSVLNAHPGKDIIAITRSLLGRKLAFAFGTVSYLLNLGIVGTAGAEMKEALGITILPLTPSLFFTILIAVVLSYIGTHGVEALSRLCVVATVLVAGLVILTTVLSANMWELASVFPILGPGVGSLLKTYGVGQAIYLEVLAIGVIAPYLRKPGEAGKAVLWSVGATAILSSLAVLTCEMVFPYPSLNGTVEPVLRVTRIIYLGRFFQRFDAVLSPIWLTSAILYGAVGTVVASLTAASTLSLKSPKTLVPITVVTAALAAVISGLLPNLSAAMAADFDLLHPYGVILLDTWPLALWVAHRFRRRAARKEDSKG